MKRIFWLLITITICCSSSGFAQFNKAGRTAMQFLKIGIGARPAALGEAAIANMNDVNSVFWNPAAITGLNKREASFTYTTWFADLNIMSGAVGADLGPIGVVAFSYVSLDYGDIPEAYVTSTSGNVDTRTGNTFGGGDLSLGVTYARKFTDKLSIGVQAKYVREKLYKYSTDLWALDVGSYYDTKFKGIRLAMSAQNFSSQARWLHTKEEAQQNFELPIVYRIGFSIDLMGGHDLFLGGDPTQHKVSVNIDAIHSNDYSERLNTGIEYTAFNMLQLRSGYKFNADEGNFSFGFGFNYNTGFLDMVFDYAYVVHDFLESPHRFTILIAM